MLSADISDPPKDESGNDGSDSRFAGTWDFPFRFEDSVGCVDDSVSCVNDSVGHVCGVGSGVFVLIGIESIGDIVMLSLFAPIGVESKSGRPIEIFLRPKS